MQQRRAAVQSTENTPKTRPEIDALIEELRSASRDETLQGRKLLGDRYGRAATALAAERDRADRAEADREDLRLRQSATINALAAPGELSEVVMLALRALATKPDSEATA
jgi:hypothetical protein